MNAPADLPNPKRRSLDEALAHRQALRAQGKRVVLTNGCFDLLHMGHLYYLRAAAGRGDALFIALNGEASVRALKGPTRPVQGDTERAYSLAALEFVDTVFTFETPRLNREIELLRPDVYVKAGDYTLETLDASEREALLSVGAKIEFMPFLPGFSTTKLIEKITQAAQAKAL